MKKLFFLALALTLGASQAQKATTVRIGLFPNVTHAAGLVAVKQGFFQKQLGGGIKLEIREFANGSQVNEAFAAGAIDFSYVGPGPAMNAFMRGVPVQVIAGAASAGAVLVSRGDVKISGLKGLAGKKIAVPTRGSTQDISLRHLLQVGGLKAQDQGGTVTIVPIDPANMPAAFAAKQVDGALVQEPWGAILEKQGAKLVLGAKEIWKGGDYTSTVLIGNTKFMAENPELTRAVLRAHLDGIAFIRKSNAAAQKAISAEITEMTKQKPDAGALFKGLSRTVVTEKLNLKTLEEYAVLNREAGFAREIPDFAKFVNLDFLKAVQP